MAAIKNEQDTARYSRGRSTRHWRSEKFSERDLLAILVGQRKVRRLLSDTRRSRGGGHLPCLEQDAVDEQAHGRPTQHGEHGTEDLAAIEFGLPKSSEQSRAQQDTAGAAEQKICPWKIACDGEKGKEGHVTYHPQQNEKKSRPQK